MGGRCLRSASELINRISFPHDPASVVLTSELATRFTVKLKWYLLGTGHPQHESLSDSLIPEAERIAQQNNATLRAERFMVMATGSEVIPTFAQDAYIFAEFTDTIPPALKDPPANWLDEEKAAFKVYETCTSSFWTLILTILPAHHPSIYFSCLYTCGRSVHLFGFDPTLAGGWPRGRQHCNSIRRMGSLYFGQDIKLGRVEYALDLTCIRYTFAMTRHTSTLLHHDTSFLLRTLMFVTHSHSPLLNSTLHCHSYVYCSFVTVLHCTFMTPASFCHTHSSTQYCSH